MTTSNQRVDRAELKKAEKLGRGGDDRLAHINSLEALILKALGGAGSTNPETGLDEFKYGGNVSEGGKTQGGADAGGQGPNAGGRGGGSFGDGPSSVGADLSTRERNLRDIENLAAGRPSALAGASGRPSAGGGTGQGGRGGTTLVGNDTTANYQAAKKAGVSPDRYNQEVTDFAGRVRDSLDTDNTTLDDIGNLFAGFLGFNEQPVDDLDFNPQKPVGPRSDWSFDPAALIGGAAGTSSQHKSTLRFRHSAPDGIQRVLGY
jgi:hypothetical protein